MRPRTRVFLHTEPPTRRVLAHADRRGERWILASDWLEDAEAFDDVLELPPPEDVEGTVRRLRAATFDALVVQTEFGLPAGVIVAAERGLPAPSPAAAYRCINKHESRRTLDA